MGNINQDFFDGVRKWKRNKYVRTVKRDFHISYHVSGRFHWTNEKEHLKPVNGEADYRRAFRNWLKFKQPQCFCIRKGKNLNESEIRKILSIVEN